MWFLNFTLQVAGAFDLCPGHIFQCSRGQTREYYISSSSTAHFMYIIIQLRPVCRLHRFNAHSFRFNLTRWTLPGFIPYTRQVRAAGARHSGKCTARAAAPLCGRSLLKGKRSQHFFLLFIYTSFACATTAAPRRLVN